MPRPRWTLALGLTLAIALAGCLGDDDVQLDQLAEDQALHVTVTPEEGSLEDTFTFDATGTPHSDALTFTWDFGDGTNATGPVVEHSFPWDNHTYRVQVEASNQTDAITGTVQVPVGTGENTDPTVTVTGDAAWVAHEDPVTVTADATDPDGDPVEVTWLLAQRHEGNDESAYGLPDETGKTGPEATFTFNESGMYRIVGQAEDPKGGTSQQHLEVKVTRTVPKTTFTFVEEDTLTLGTGAGVTGFSASELLYEVQEPSQNTYIDAARYETSLQYPGTGTVSLDWSNATTPAALELVIQNADGQEVLRLNEQDPTVDRLESQADLDAGSYTLLVRANAAAETAFTLTMDLDLHIPRLTT